MLKILSPALILGFAVTSSAFAAMPLITDDTGTQGAAGNQLEFSLGEDKTKDTAGFTAKSLQRPALTYTRGLTDTLDAYVAATWLKNTSDDPAVADATGSSNTGVGAKWRLFENERKTSFAVKATYFFPVSEDKQNKGLGDGEASWDGTLILSQELPFGSAHANIGFGKVGVKNDDDEKTTHVSVAPIFDLGESFKLAVDLGQDSSKPKGGVKTKTHYREVGAIYSPHKDVDLALGYIRTKVKDVAEVTRTITGGVTWRF